MIKNDNKLKYLKLIKEYPEFVYEKYEYSINNESIDILYTFKISERHIFNPRLSIARRDFFIDENFSSELMNNLIFNLGMIELVSYWKSTCSPVIKIKPCNLSGEQINWWKKVYFHGLGEFFYLNSIDANIDDFVTIVCESDIVFHSTEIKFKESTIVPIGGGKDSIVTLNHMKEMKEQIRCLIVNPRKATIETVKQAGINPDDIITINRTIHPHLLKMNSEGYLNGHTPFSALLAFITVISSAITGIKNVALSNESSANEVTVSDSMINHQYSKSFEFEADFRHYANKYLLREYNYYSYLRPLNELQIAKLFSGYKKYFKIFKSCNEGSKTDKWCCSCAKCLFTYIILSPFISEKEIKDIFGENLYEKPGLQSVFNQLTGRDKIKPFDCIGTIEEINAALCMTIMEMNKKSLPFLLNYFFETGLYNNCKGFNRKTLLNQFDAKNFLNSQQIEFLKKKL